MDKLKDIIPAERMAEYRREVEKMNRQLTLLNGTFVDRVGFLHKMVVRYYERKFLKLTKRLTNG